MFRFRAVEYNDTIRLQDANLRDMHRHVQLSRLRTIIDGHEDSLDLDQYGRLTAPV